MNSDLFVFLLMILFWIISQFMSWLGKRARSQRIEYQEVEYPADMSPDGEAADPAALAKSRQASMQKTLRDLAERMGADVVVEPAEPPPGWTEGEHRGTAGEHQRTASEVRATATESALEASEHRRSRSEVEGTPSEAALSTPEHRWVASEHVRGDRDVPDIPLLPVPGRRRRAAPFVRRLRRELRSRDREALARAIVLGEILGPPIAMRPPDRP